MRVLGHGLLGLSEAWKPGKVVLTWTHSFVVLCLLCVCPGESDPAPQSSVLSRKCTVSVLV